jgi:hypothetical protein
VNPSRHYLARWIFVMFTGLYLLCSGGHIYTPDGVVMYRVTQAIAEQGRTDISTRWLPREFGGVRFEDPATGNEHLFAKYGLGYTLASLPGYFLGKGLLPSGISDMGLSSADAKLTGEAAGDRARSVTEWSVGDSGNELGLRRSNSFDGLERRRHGVDP